MGKPPPPVKPAKAARTTCPPLRDGAAVFRVPTRYHSNFAVILIAKRKRKPRGLVRGSGLRRKAETPARSAGALPERGRAMNVILVPLYQVLSIAIQLYIWALIASAVLSWLIAFNVINTRNRFVYTVMDTLYRVTEPALRPIRRVLPNFGGIDISPIIVILLLYFIQSVLGQLVFRVTM